jgi:hypothetical protein
MRNGRYGWWWNVDGAEYFYEQPAYPYPLFVWEVEAMEEEPAEPVAVPAPAPPTPGGIVGGLIGNAIGGAINDTLRGLVIEGGVGR